MAALPHRRCYMSQVEAMNLKSELVEVLTRLTTCKLEPSCELLKTADATTELLLIAFDLGRKGVEFTEEEKSTIGPLIFKSLKNLECGINYSFEQLESQKISTAKTLRSGLQFFVDNFKEFPVSLSEKCTLQDDLTRLTSLEVEELTLLIKQWSLPPGEEIAPDTEGVPASHSWWD